jgi:hypothetical protein
VGDYKLTYVGVENQEQPHRSSLVTRFAISRDGSDLGVLDLGKLSVIHGYHAGASACRMHANIYRNCIFGHVHTIESAPVPAREPAEALSIGCLCRKDMDYINKKTGKLRWAQGWAYGLLFPDGTYQLFQTRNINGQFYAASEVKTYHA